jgi:hypothetical protein
MTVPRRRFLGSVAAAPLALGRWTPWDGSWFARQDCTACLLVDWGESGALPESVAGFARGLAACGIAFERVGPGAIKPARLLLVPGGILRAGEVAWTLRQLCAAGTAVVYETGAGYAESALFGAEQRLLRSYFGVDADPPVTLWPQHAEAGSLPYVHYRWPLPVMVRDFSRLVPVRGEDASEVARIGDIPAACRRRIGRGEFICCGSPIGPHLGAGDPQAQAWLKSLLLRYSRTLAHSEQPGVTPYPAQDKAGASPRAPAYLQCLGCCR